MIAIRTDANANTGEGHVMRTLAIAQAIRRQGGEAAFITGDAIPAKRIRSAGFKQIVLESADMQNEMKPLQRALKVLNAHTLLVDSYSASPAYFEQLKGIVRTAYIDDFGEQAYPADVVVNYNISCGRRQLRTLYAGKKTRLLAGAKFAALREEFGGVGIRPVKKALGDIMITTGSTDHYGMALKLARAFAAEDMLKNARLHIVAGRFYTQTKALLELKREHPNMFVYKAPRDMKSIMLACDMAISAGGTTLYELCACGLPCVVFGLADNQQTLRQAFAKKGVMIDCGDCRYRADITDDIIAAVKKLQSARLRAQMRGKARAVTDGRGARRIACELLKREAADTTSKRGL